MAESAADVADVAMTGAATGLSTGYAASVTLSPSVTATKADAVEAIGLVGCFWCCFPPSFFPMTMEAAADPAMIEEPTDLSTGIEVSEYEFKSSYSCSRIV